MRYTHAVIVRIPQTVNFDSKKQTKKTDLTACRKQQEDLNDTLREVCLHTAVYVVFNFMVSGGSRSN
jgi:hypothetical protein